MATINEIIYNIRMEIKDNRSDDIKLSDRNLEFIVNYLRIKLARQDIQKHKSISPSMIQSLGVVDLELVDPSLNDNFDTGIKVLRTSNPVPVPLDVDGKIIITNIAGLDGVSTIDFTDRSKALKKKWSKYAGKRTSAYYLDGHIYIVGCPKELRYITLEGVFENPREVSKFKNKDGSVCYDPNKDRYPISAHMIDMINSLVKRQELDLYFQLIEDKINDGQTNA